MIQIIKIFLVIAAMCLCAGVFCTYYDAYDNSRATTEAHSVTVVEYNLIDEDIVMVFNNTTTATYGAVNMETNDND